MTLVLALILSVSLNLGLTAALFRSWRHAKRLAHFGATLTVEPFVRPMSARGLRLVRKQ